MQNKRWFELVTDFNKIEILNWPDQDKIWHNRPEEFEISIFFKDKMVIKRLNNGIKLKFSKIDSILKKFRY